MAEKTGKNKDFLDQISINKISYKDVSKITADADTAISNLQQGNFWNILVRNFIRPSKINEINDENLNDANLISESENNENNEELDVDIAGENKPKSLTTSEENFINNLRLAEFQADFDSRLAEKFDVLMQRINEISSALSQSGIVIKRLRE